MPTKVGRYSATHESVTVAVGRDRKNTDRVKKLIRLQDSLPCPLKNK